MGLEDREVFTFTLKLLVKAFKPCCAHAIDFISMYSTCPWNQTPDLGVASAVSAKHLHHSY